MREKTCVVEGRREARTVEAMRAALVEREAGNLWGFFSGFYIRNEIFFNHATKAYVIFYDMYRKLRVEKKRRGGKLLT